MSSSDGQPPLTRRQVRDLERAREAGAAVAAATGSVPVVSAPVGSVPAPQAAAAQPSSAQQPTSSESSAAVSRPEPSSPAPSSIAAPGSISDPGRTLTRRELRALRDAETTRSSEPVPLQAPAPEPRRDLSEALQGVDRMVSPLDGDVSPDEAGDHDGPAVASGAVSSPPQPADEAVRPAESVSPAEPTPRSVVRDTPAGDSVLPVALDGDDDGDDASPAGIRRSGQASPSPSAPRPASAPDPVAAPRPSSTPGVFPFDLGTPAGASSAATPTTPSGRPVSVPASADLTGDEPPRPTPAVHSPSQPAVATGTTTPSVPPVPPNGALSVPASAPNPSGYVPPVGHWSTQADEPDDDTVAGRSLGTHTGQTNALILTDQQVADVTGALNATGEIIITGSIDLPRSLGSTGSQARIDTSDIDRLMEQGDAEQADTDAEPVRASRAISTHTSTRAVVLAAAQPKTNRLPLYLGIGGGVIGAGIIGVIIAGFISGIL